MSFRKPFRAVPIKLGGHYRQARRRSAIASAVRYAVAAVVLGSVAGTASIMIPSGFTSSTAAPLETRSVTFELCHTGGGRNCVVDGDTIWKDGVKIRIADIDAPETHPPRCPREAELGQRATLRLQALLNEGPFAVETIGWSEDR